MTNIIPLQRKRSPGEERSLQAYQKAMSGEGMSVQEAKATLAGIHYNPKWKPEELFAAVPEDKIDQVFTALTIAAGAQFAEAEALDNYMTDRRGEA